MYILAFSVFWRGYLQAFDPLVVHVMFGTPVMVVLMYVPTSVIFAVSPRHGGSQEPEVSHCSLNPPSVLILR